MIERLKEILADDPHDKFEGINWFLLSEDELKEVISIIEKI